MCLQQSLCLETSYFRQKQLQPYCQTLNSQCSKPISKNENSWQLKFKFSHRNQDKNQCLTPPSLNGKFVRFFPFFLLDLKYRTRMPLLPISSLIATLHLLSAAIFFNIFQYIAVFFGIFQYFFSIFQYFLGMPLFPISALIVTLHLLSAAALPIFQVREVFK